MTRPITTLTILAITALAIAALQLTGCDQASGGTEGSNLQDMIMGPPLTVDGPRYALQKDGGDMSDGHGGALEYTDPVIAGVILERLAISDPRSLYTVQLRGGHWGMNYESDGETPVFSPADVYVAQNGASGQALNAPLVSGEATFQIQTTGFVEWYLDGALVAEGPSATVNLTRGEHQLITVIWSEDGASQSIELPLYVEVNLTSVELEWTIPSERENGVALGVEELCCYQVQYIHGNEFAVVDVSGGATRAVNLALQPGHYRFSVIAIDSAGRVSQPSDTLEANVS
jgi:hypothetical protein